MGGWLDTDNKTISVQLNLTGTATGTELGKIKNSKIVRPQKYGRSGKVNSIRKILAMVTYSN